MRINKQNLERIAKLNIIVTNEIIPLFHNTLEFVHLLTLLIFNNLWNIKSAEATFHKKSIITDLINQLFMAQNFYSQTL